jgi:hypothetical protein
MTDTIVKTQTTAERTAPKTNWFKFVWEKLTSPFVWLVVGFFGLYFLTASFSFFSTDGEVMYQTTREIALNFRLNQPPTPGLSQIFQGTDGLYYSKYGLGQPLLAAAFYKVGLSVHWRFMREKPFEPVAHFFVALLPIVVTALTVGLVYLWAKELYRSQKIAIGLAVVAGLATSLWVYSHFFFSEPLYMLGIFGGAYAVWKAYQSKERTLSHNVAFFQKKVWSYFWRYGWLVLGGVGMGYAVMTRAAGVTLLPAFVLFIAMKQDWKGKGWFGLIKDGVAFGLGALPFALLLMFYNNVRSGSPFNNAYEGEGFTTPVWEGVWGLLFSTGKSVFMYVPVLIALPFTFRDFWRRFKPETLFFGLLIGVTLLYSGAWWSWYGGFSWGPRFMVPVLPFAVLMLGVLLQKSRLWVIVLFVGLLPVSVFVQMAGIMIDFNTHLGEVTKFQPGWDANYNWIPSLSPLRYHFVNMWNGDINVVRGLTLEQLGLNRRGGLIFTTGAWLAFGLGLLVLGYRYARLVQKQGFIENGNGK